MKKMIWALIFGAIAVLPAHAEDLAIPAASGNDAADSAKIEQYMEQAVDKQLAAMRSSLPMKVSAGRRLERRRKKQRRPPLHLSDRH